jgi:hypothetical protein
MYRGPSAFRFAMLSAALGPVGFSFARVEVTVNRVGFPAASGDDVVRTSAWAPVVVDVALLDQPAFDGRLRLGQFDNDGDEAFDQIEVHLSSEMGGTRRFVLYTLPNLAQGGGKFEVELQTTDGEALEVMSQGQLTRRALPVRLPNRIPDDDLLILSVSTGTLGRMSDLTDPQQRETGARTLHVSHVAPGDLPEQWIGLEAVDFVRWEAANPNDLTERQVQALVHWVRHGGTLLIMASPGDASFNLRKPLNDILPADLGSLYSTDSLDGVYQRLLSDPGENDPPRYHPAVPLVRCTARSGSAVLARDEAGRSDVVTRRRVGRGCVIFAGITEQNLFRGTGSASAVGFYRKVFLLSTDKPLETEAVSLFPYIIGVVSFMTWGVLYLGAAAVFSIGYVVFATFGLWSFLSARGLRQHNWTAFAIVAFLASAVSVLAVNSLRGFGERLAQVSVIDTEAGTTYGYGAAFFGLKTGTDRSLDVWLPSDPVVETEPSLSSCLLRPLPAVPDFREVGGGFADPQAYRLVPASALIEDVRIRGTLKQFEGRWEGRTGGKITAQVTVRQEPGSKTDWRITPESYLVNELGVTLEGCYLLQPRFDILAPLDRDSDLQNSLRRHDQIYSFPLGDGVLAKDGGRVLLAPLCYSAGDQGKEFQPAIDRQLKHAHANWVVPFRGAIESVVGSGDEEEEAISLDHFDSAVLLLSTLGDFDPMEYAAKRGIAAGFASMLKTWSRDRLRQLDLRERLERDCVYLIGFARDPGPIRLCRRQGGRDFTPLEPDANDCRTVYRVRIPVSLEANATGPD